MRLRLPPAAAALAAPMLALRSLNAREHLGRFRAALQPRRGIFRCRYFSSARGTKSLPCGLRARRRPPRNKRVQAETDRDHLSVPANGCLQTDIVPANERVQTNFSRHSPLIFPPTSPFPPFPPFSPFKPTTQTRQCALAGDPLATSVCGQKPVETF